MYKFFKVPKFCSVMRVSIGYGARFVFRLGCCLGRGSEWGKQLFKVKAFIQARITFLCIRVCVLSYLYYIYVFKQAEAVGFGAVSYTHLDVYKRQVSLSSTTSRQSRQVITNSKVSMLSLIHICFVRTSLDCTLGICICLKCLPPFD